MELASLSPGLRTDALAEVWDFAVDGPSKQTRSRLLFAAEETARGGLGSPDPRTDTAAAAVELFHLASLPHDDLMDDSDVRRGLQSLPARFGAPLAAAGGGLFIGRALSLFAACGPEAVSIAAQTIERMCEGQMLELRDRYDPGRAPARCLDAIKGKTAGMFWLAAKLGAMLGDADAATQTRIAQYGLALGVGYQIIDDVLDIAADESLTGKSHGSDLHNGNYTVVVLYALEQDPQLLGVLEAREIATEDVMKRILKTQAVPRASADARQWISDAKESVRDLPAGGGLLAIADAELARLDDART
jgi:geranylgeranyl pyrophosphate synthase